VKSNPESTMANAPRRRSIETKRSSIRRDWLQG
jgi:hypothetical protein